MATGKKLRRTRIKYAEESASHQRRRQLLGRRWWNRLGRLERFDLLIDLSDDVARERPEMQVERQQRHDISRRFRVGGYAVGQQLAKDVARFRQIGNQPVKHFQATEFVPGIAGSGLSL